VLESMAGSIVSSDVQASNVPVYAGDTFIAGAKVLRQYGLGPLPGVAMMVVLISRSGYCTITLRYDKAAITDPELLASCLLAGFDEVLALGGDGRASPATFTTASATSAEAPATSAEATATSAEESSPISRNGSAAQ
jgi:diacylglycerol O-acyltransferase / wax synthase